MADKLHSNGGLGQGVAASTTRNLPDPPISRPSVLPRVQPTNLSALRNGTQRQERVMREILQEHPASWFPETLPLNEEPKLDLLDAIQIPPEPEQSPRRTGTVNASLKRQMTDGKRRNVDGEPRQ